VVQKDSSIYLSDLMFSCLAQPNSLISFGEFNEYKLNNTKNYLTIDLMMNLPVDKELTINILTSQIIKFHSIMAVVS